MPPPGINTDGVSAGAIRSFLQGLETAFPEKHKDMTTQEACVEFVVPQTEEKQCAYIDVMRDQNASDDVRPATVFVSHAWRYKIVDVLTTLLEFAEEEESKHGRKTHFWFDLFMNNQHQNVTANLPQEWWSTTFKESIASIGKVLLVLTPWNNPVPLTRAWCLWEIFCSISQPEVELEIRLPSAQTPALKQAVLHDFEAVVNMLVEVQAEKAEAWKAEDRDMIFGAIRASVGFPALNKVVKDQMRQWCLATVHAFVDEAEAAFSRDTAAQKQGQRPSSEALEPSALAQLCGQVGTVMTKFGAHEKAIAFYKRDLELTLRAVGEDHENTGITLNNLGNAHMSRHELGEAAQCFRRAAKIWSKVLGPTHARVGAACNNLGSVYKTMNDVDTAMTWYRRALDIRMSALGEEHPETAATIDNMGSCHQSMQNYDAAIACFVRALKIKTKLLGAAHPETAITYNNLGSALEGKGDTDQAIEYYLKALRVKQDTYGAEHPSTAITHGNLGNSYASKGDFGQAVSHLETALRVFTVTVGASHPHAALVAKNLGIVRQWQQQQQQHTGDEPPVSSSSRRQEDVSRQQLLLRFLLTSLQHQARVDDIVQQQRLLMRFLGVHA
ncbi:hypothetical protein PTSG_08770 [Salpingoeca rosetta]|uniref:Uncharacterized protein n=1 Tax=Salpingoeca rosetta (strain ATCC 50818 / BSB-021) TaxID=946362 RepID=F2UKM9_SALR5|nr:uncharacterized protein PTSG_08770 [Salpingoeca rosetta]EGD77678.1 hypothetical protein PTSG_08770 [Salpingoeca rosetta]|eukprot:XP_004990154.1 hypothetical protein PTSG_08770 [Salpingoeca rosetta]